ncbi:hypothetical protein SRB5_68920 [Streptomyces sp. RB5]|uniref:Uncharacterized protein n=1 Tax=Streptomyces smaragdinus TaxID=2585196 RepID=A0A7K0CTA9_9ACTN|nr:hypothetical protein [Streptomyces smaragdinus]
MTCSSSPSRSGKSGPRSPRSARDRSRARRVAAVTYSATAFLAGFPCVRVTRSRASFRARKDASAYGSGTVSQPAVAYPGSVSRRTPSSAPRAEIASQISSPNTGIMNSVYTPRKPAPPKTSEPFHIPCITIAASSPAIGSRIRRAFFPRAARAARANPMPVIAVKSGWANGEKMPRITNVTTVTDTPLS